MTLNGVMALFCVILTNLVVFWVHYVKVAEDTLIHSASEM